MQFKPDKPSINLEKQKLWNEWELKVEKIIDKNGKHIDSRIKESVIAFNVFGIKTAASCEGHLDSGLPYPWIDIETISKESLIKKFPDYEEIRRITREKNYKNSHEIEEDDPLLYQKMLIIENYISKIKEEFKNKINAFLKEFYSLYTPYSPEGKIEAHESAGSGFRIETAHSRGLGLDNWKKFDDKMNNMGIEKKKSFLENNQKEMKAFADFLKNKFLEEK